jgi:hypothetical protein
VHWQVNLPRDEIAVRLHVESPRHKIDPSLNETKRKVIDALLSSNLGQSALQKGYTYKTGNYIKDAHIKKNRSTEVFRITPNGNQRGKTPEQLIALVHAAIGIQVDALLGPFISQLK